MSLANEIPLNIRQILLYHMKHYRINRLPYSRECSQRSRYSFTLSKFGNGLPRCVIKLNKVNCKWEHYTRLSFRNRC